MTTAAAPRWYPRSMDWTLEDVLEATGGVAPAAAGLSFSSVAIDSREVGPGSLFVALRGRRRDGHGFVAEALARGAAGALVERVPAGVPRGRLIVVEDTVRALGDLAAWVRRNRWRAPVVAITGSNGKTTTKEMVAAICECGSGDGDPLPAVRKTPGNRNNLIGLPLTILGASGEEKFGVLELGMNAPGEIARLAQIAVPRVGVVTNVGPAHLEGLGTLEEVAAAKGELLDALGPGTTAVLNADDPLVMAQARRAHGRVLTFGERGEVRAEGVEPAGLEGTAFELVLPVGRVRVRVPLPGPHNVANALAAAAAAVALGFPPARIAAGISRVAGPAMRMAVHRLANGVTIVNDGYNANPASMGAALRAVAAAAPGRVLAVLGEMRELGREAAELHAATGRLAAEIGVQVVVALHCPPLAAGAREAGAAEVVEAGSVEAAAAEVAARWRRGDTVLLKGSRGDDTEDAVRRSGSRMGEVERLLRERGGG